NFNMQASVPHQHLHSFPTRRSSDLDIIAADPCLQRNGCPAPSPAADTHGWSWAVAVPPTFLRFGPETFRSTLMPTRRKVGGTARSEEHTSELQSRSDLVCRLLLEKK